jgi:hypothetical protein
MLGKVMVGFIFLPFVLGQTTGCSMSASGTLYKTSEPEGEEYQAIGVVNGLWEYDLDENRSRLQELLPEDAVYDVDQAAELYQVRVGIKRSLFGASATEVVVLPEGWSYTTESDVEGDNVVNIGDVVAIRAQQNRMVDYFTEIVRKCNQSPGEDERPEWDIGCQSISEFDEEGYGGNTYLWIGF